MKKRGRPRKAARRTASGQISRAKIDRGNERAQAKFDKFGTDGADAIGRAYRSGLLGDEGKRLLDTARAMFRAYWPMLQVGKEGCTLADRGGVARIDTARDAERERALLWKLRTIDAQGYATRRAFDQLVIDVNCDTGPDWLDRIIDKHGRPDDWATLERALDGLRMIAGVAVQHAA